MTNCTKLKMLVAASFAAITSFGAFAEWGGMENPGTLIENSDMSGLEMAIASDGSTYVVWTKCMEGHAFSLNAQLLDSQGKKMWGENGIIVDEHKTPTWYSYWNIVVTPSDELVISWADARSEENSGVSSYQAQNPVLYKIDKNGKMLWGDEGIALDPKKYEFPAQLFQVGENIYAKCYPCVDSDPTQLILLDEFGEPAWNYAKNFSGQIIGSEDDDFLAVYSSSNGVMAMRYSKDMRQRWKAPALISEKLYGGYDVNPYILKSDGQGGMAVCYLTPLDQFNHMPLVAYVTASGETAFSEDVANTLDYDHLYPVMNINPETETIMTIWQLNSTYSCLQGAQMDYFGERQWGDIGKTIAQKKSPTHYSYGPIAVEPLSDGGWLICYADELGWNNSQLYLARYDSEGNAVWSKPIGTPCSVTVPLVYKNGDNVRVLWVEDNDYVDENGQDQSCKSLRGVSVDINSVEGIEGIMSDNSTAKGREYYSINGIRLNGPTKGINIVKNADGSVSKIIIK